MEKFAGRVTVVLTPALRKLALTFIRESEPGEDDEILTAWFNQDETDDEYVLDAARSEAEALMILTIARAIHSRYE